MAHTSIIVGVLANWQLYDGTTAHRYLLALFQGITFGARERQCRLLLSCGIGSGVRPHNPTWPVPMPQATFAPVGPWNCDGLIVVPPFTNEARTEYIAELRASGYPVVFAGAGEQGPTVAIDNAAAIKQALAHILDHGHQRIGFISGHARLTGDSGKRHAAFLAAMHDFGVPINPAAIMSGDHSFEGGKQAMRQLLACANRPSAVIASNDESAFGAASAIREAGLRVPDDIALIGFDDILDARIQSPPLTTIHNPTFELGYRSLVALDDLLAGTWDGAATIAVPTRLVIRRSCGCQFGQPMLTQRVQPTSTLVDRMTEAALTETQRSQPEAITILCGQLVSAFQRALAEDQPQAFATALTDVVRQTEAMAEDVAIWQSALTVLRDAFISEAATATQGSNMIDQGRVIVSERIRRQTTRALVQHMGIADRVGALTAQLLAVVDETHIAATLATQLASVGIQHMLVARYSVAADDPFAWSTLALQSGLAVPARTRRFSSRSFPPTGIYLDTAPWQLAILPLVIDHELIGFGAFDASNLEVCAALVQNIASALRTIRLYAEAREGRRLAEEANRLKSRFLSVVSHELRSPLNLITGLSDMLLRETAATGTPNQLRDDLEHISASAQHLGRLIGDILDLSSSEIGQLRLVCEPLDLSAALQLVAVTGQRMAEEKGLQWICTLPIPGPLVLGDQTRLRQVALNLLSNAVKCTTHGTITLSIHRIHGFAMVQVQDTGMGIPLADQASVFDEFRRTERSIALGYRGLGLGLAICKQLVELHGGTISVQSSGIPGAGSLFTVQLPLVVEMIPGPAADHHDTTLTAPHGEAISAPHVLIADDDPAIRALHRRIMLAHSATAQVDEAANGELALARIRAMPPDLVLLDLLMPELDGFGVLAAMRADPALHDIPVIVLTAQVLTDVEIARLGQGVTAILVKGVFTAEETLAHIDAALARRHTHGNATQRLVHKALGFIHANFSNPLSREQIALHIGVNENYLTDCFHREMGITPMTYLARYRIQRAQLLLIGEQSITVIALAVGFGDSAYFSRVFQREVGLSPSAYRRAQRATRKLLS